MDSVEDETPTAEKRPFTCYLAPPQRSLGQDSKSNSNASSCSSESVSSSSTGGARTDSRSSSTSSSEAPSSNLAQGGARRKKGQPRRASATGKSDMSNSYHEIFDSQMPPERTRLLQEQREEQEAAEAQLAKVTLLPCDTTAEETTMYLTSKLVQDSLLWQKEHAQQLGDGVPSANASPLDSPSRKEKPEVVARGNASSLDPSLILDIENDARHLATSVDNLIESLSGVLQSISALTVSAVETYRDGVCKTCDEVDGNIKSMYQLMAKVEELNKSMAPAYKMGEQLKEIKRLLEMYEAVANNTR